MNKKSEADTKGKNYNLANYHCPRFDELPKFYVYMDQLILIVNEYLAPFEVDGEENGITVTMVNNYVKRKIIPPPENKRYSKTHIIYLFVLGLLKNVFSISVIGFLIEVSSKEYPIDRAYNFFAEELENALRATFETRDFSDANSEKEGTKISLLVHSALLAFANNVYVRKNAAIIEE